MSGIVLLLQAVLALLLTVQGNPNATPEQQQAVQAIASQAIQQTTAYLASASQTQTVPVAQSPAATPIIAPSGTPITIPETSQPVAQPAATTTTPMATLTVAPDSLSPLFLDSVYKLTSDGPVTVKGIVFEVSPEDRARIYPAGIPLRLPDHSLAGRLKTKDCPNATVTFNCPAQAFVTVQDITIAPDALRFIELPQSGHILSVEANAQVTIAP